MVTKARLEEIDEMLENTTGNPVLPEGIEQLAKMSWVDARLFANSRDIIIELRDHILENCEPAHPITELQQLAAIHPGIEKLDQGLAWRFMTTAKTFAPTVMQDSQLLGCWVKSTTQMGYVDVGIIKTLLEAEELHRALSGEEDKLHRLATAVRGFLGNLPNGTVIGDELTSLQAAVDESED